MNFPVAGFCNGFNHWNLKLFGLIVLVIFLFLHLHLLFSLDTVDPRKTKPEKNDSSSRSMGSRRGVVNPSDLWDSQICFLTLFHPTQVE